MADSADIEAELDALFERFSAGAARKVGFPGGEDIDYSPLNRLLGFELNNAGDSWHDPIFNHHTKPQEREVVEFFADLFRAPADDRWGYITSGSTECLHFGLRRARQCYPGALAYYSTAAHYKVPRVLEDLRMDACEVPADSHGEISYAHLRAAIAANLHRPVILALTAGTTMTEAVDDVRCITAILNDLGVVDRYIHIDGALSAPGLALRNPMDRPGFDFADGADSIGFSLHKVLATRTPGGVVIQRHSPAPGTRTRVPYTGAADTTFSCSRDGFLALKAWYAVKTLGIDGLRARADRACETAEYLVRRLGELGWPAWRHPHAMTVVLKTPPPPIALGWMLPPGGDGWSHYICLPGRDKDQVDQFIADFGDYLRTANAGNSATEPVRSVGMSPNGNAGPGYPPDVRPDAVAYPIRAQATT